MDCLKDMWKLQQVEVEMVQLRKEWSKLKELLDGESSGDLQQIQADIDSSRMQWKETKKEYEEAVTEIEAINRQLNQLNQQLYSSQDSKSKELVSIQQKIQQLKTRKADLDKKQLSCMQVLDGLENKIADETQRHQRLDECRRSRTNRVKQRQLEVKKDYQDLKLERQQLREAIPSHMLVIYNSLVANKKRPMALLKEDSCGACGMTQTVLNVHALKKGGQYTRCNNCGRILVLEKLVNK